MSRSAYITQRAGIYVCVCVYVCMHRSSAPTAYITASLDHSQSLLP